MTTIGKGQSTDESSGSPGTFSPETFEEDYPPDPSELKQIEILEKVTDKLLHFLIPTVRLMRTFDIRVNLNCFNFYVNSVLSLFLRP